MLQLVNYYLLIIVNYSKLEISLLIKIIELFGLVNMMVNMI